MYLPIPPSQTCASAWISAVTSVNAQPNHEAFNVIIDVADPVAVTTSDKKIIGLVDKFLESHSRPPLQTIANTIFPESTYQRYGSPKFYEVYLKTVYPKIKHGDGGWGRYFERMINCDSGTEHINPLAELVSKLHDQLNGGGRVFRNIYEIGIYDPAMDIRIYDQDKDAGRNMNRQCLSFLSFKLNNERKVSVTAVYRNHYYIARLLGNMIGLGRLLNFIAAETGAIIGSLTIVSTHAQVDSSPWKRKEIEALISDCI